MDTKFTTCKNYILKPFWPPLVMAKAACACCLQPQRVLHTTTMQQGTCPNRAAGSIQFSLHSGTACAGAPSRCKLCTLRHRGMRIPSVQHSTFVHTALHGNFDASSRASICPSTWHALSRRCSRCSAAHQQVARLTTTVMKCGAPTHVHIGLHCQCVCQLIRHEILVQVPAVQPAPTRHQGDHQVTTHRCHTYHAGSSAALPAL
jgi:hypothetical protein